MANSVYLSRFSYDFKNEKPISIKEWQDCAAHFSFDFKQTNEEATIEFYCEEVNDTIPLFWINAKDGRGEMKEEGFFNFGIDERLQIAEYLKVLVVSQENDIVFVSNCGDLFDNETDNEAINLNIDDLIQNQILFKDDMKQTIMDLNFMVKQVRERREQKKAKYIETSKSWWRFW